MRLPRKLLGMKAWDPTSMLNASKNLVMFFAVSCLVKNHAIG